MVGSHFFKVWPSKTTQGVCLLWGSKTPAPQVVTFADCTKSTAVCSGWFEESALLKRIFSHSLTCRALKNLQTYPKWSGCHMKKLIITPHSLFFCRAFCWKSRHLWYESIFASSLLSRNLWSNFGENRFTLAAFFPKFPKRLGGKLISPKKIKKTPKHNESSSAFSCFKTERKSVRF